MISRLLSYCDVVHKPILAPILEPNPVPILTPNMPHILPNCKVQ
jgi:hypothetical protein